MKNSTSPNKFSTYDEYEIPYGLIDNQDGEYYNNKDTSTQPIPSYLYWLFSFAVLLPLNSVKTPRRGPWGGLSRAWGLASCHNMLHISETVSMPAVFTAYHSQNIKSPNQYIEAFFLLASPSGSSGIGGKRFCLGVNLLFKIHSRNHCFWGWRNGLMKMMLGFQYLHIHLWSLPWIHAAHMHKCRQASLDGAEAEARAPSKGVEACCAIRRRSRRDEVGLALPRLLYQDWAFLRNPLVFKGFDIH